MLGEGSHRLWEAKGGPSFFHLSSVCNYHQICMPMAVRRCTLGVLVAIVLLWGRLPSALHAQEVELLYDDGGAFSSEKYVMIAHSGPEGTVSPDTAAVRSANRVYFAFEAKGDWTFESEDRQTLREIALLQDTSTLVPETVRLVGGEEASTAVVGVPKAEVDWLTPVQFRHDLGTSRGLSLNEYYAPGYVPLQGAYEAGRRLLDAGQPLRAVEALRPFYEEVERPFSIVDRGRAVLDTASSEALAQARSTFRTLRKSLVAEATADGLARLDSFRVRLDSIETVLTPYLDARPAAGAGVQDRLDNITNSVDQLYANARDSYRQKTLRLFMRETYDNPKLRLYLDGLTQMLVDTESALEGRDLQVDSLRPALLGTPRFAEARRQLEAEGWADEFREVVALVNENIHERQEVFGDEIMESLRLRRPAAPQPYYEIVAAMNAVLTDDQMGFSESWDRALEKGTDLSLIDDLQRWRLARRLAPDAVPNRARILIEEAEGFRRTGELGAAEDRFQLAVRLVDGYAPLVYDLGRVKQARGDTAAARDDFLEARKMAPSYAPPEVRVLRTQLDRGKYEQALARSDSLLQRQSYWLFYMPKARALVGLERYNDAVPVLRGRCEPLNDKSYALYAVLAEVYAAMGTWKGARRAVQQADALSPQRKGFEQRIAAVRAQAQEEGVSLMEVDADSAGTGGVREPADTTDGAGLGSGKR
jgi:tetratricopeptide (TPR) repeat protein